MPTTHLVAALAPVLTLHSGLSLRLVATDDQMDLTTERIDLAIAIGTKPPASSLVRRHLATWENVLVAAPAYLAARGKPKDIKDLVAHDFIALPPWHHRGDVLTGPSGLRYRLQVKPRVTSNNQHTIRQLALAGFGLSFHVVPEIAEELAQGRLVRILPKWSTAALSVDALMPPRTAQPAKVRAATAALEKYLAARRAR